MTNILRTEGFEKLTGKAIYTDDWGEKEFPGLLHGTTVRATIPRGVLKSVKFLPGIPWEEFTVVSAKDIPGKNYLPIIENDWPFLVDEKINHYGEAILLLSHHDKYLIQKAHKFIEIQYQELPAVLSMEESQNKNEIIYKQDNILKKYVIEKGDVDSIWSHAYKIIEGVYQTGAQEQLYIEPNAMIANFEKNNGLTIWGSMQCPYYIHEALMPLFNLGPEKIRIIQMETGGGFGGKEEFPSLLAGHAGLLSYKSGRPVKMIYSRSEDMANTTKRHPSKTWHKTAVDKNGKLLAVEINFNLDGGAYLTLSSVVLSRGAIHAAGPYYCNNVRVKAQAYATNNFPYGAFRGFGAPQSIFAMERHLDVIAKELKLDPIILRRRNFLRSQEQTSTGQTIKELVDFNTLMDKALEKSKYYEKLMFYQKENKNSHLKKGLGVASFMHGAGFTGSGEVFLESEAEITTTKNGEIVLLASSVEMGQGKNTVFTQIVSEVLKIYPTDVVNHRPDTKFVPDSGPTVASRTSMVVGKLLEQAALMVRDELINQKYLKEKYTRDDFIKAIKEHFSKKGELKKKAKYQAPPNVHWDDEKYQGDAYATYAWAVYVSEVEVNTLTYESKVLNFYAINEVGKVLNHTLAAGQIEGGIVQAIGMALYEKVQYKNGVMVNNQMTNYIIPTSLDVPHIEVYFEEWNKNFGPSGAKGIGELPMDGPGPSTLNAIMNACDINATTIPLLPEDMMKLMEAR